MGWKEMRAVQQSFAKDKEALTKSRNSVLSQLEADRKSKISLIEETHKQAVSNVHSEFKSKYDALSVSESQALVAAKKQ